MKFKIPESAHQYRKRRGRGLGSGHGKTSCRGYKGQRARSGKKLGTGFEGGQMPAYRRLPKFGFNSPFPKSVQIVNLSVLANLAKTVKTEITPEVLYQKGIIKKTWVPVKILGQGELTQAMNIKAHSFSESAKQKIEKAGGKIELIPQDH